MILEICAASLFVSIPTIKQGWLLACDNISEWNMTIWGLFIALVAGYFLGCVPYIVLDTLRIPFFEQYKIQQTKYPGAAQYMKTVAGILALFFVVVLPMLICSFPIFDAIGVAAHAPLPPWYVVAPQLGVFFLIEDYLNYWFHRALHTEFLYKKIHSVHHEHNAPFAIAATYAHPIEVLLLGVPTFAGPLVMGPHLITMIIWLLMRQYEAIDIHSGYEFPWSINKLCSFYAGTEHHDYHHYIYVGNYASVFTWCDRVYGTNMGYDKWLAKKEQ
mmetsp:Transcript_1165/g.3286  ORF Transcript_1165/g.3286 Transcript_1165/m.3286 type:complete len:273 (+) Transcript_1165:58-876(+)